MSCVTQWWFRVVVRVKQSYEIPRSRRSLRMSSLFASASSRGDTPFRSADTITGVPCSSVPLTIRTSLPLSLWYRANTSADTAKPATCPMWRGPLAYGHAGATRIFCDSVRTCSLGGRGRATDDTSGRDAARGEAADCEQGKRQCEKVCVALLVRRNGVPHRDRGCAQDALTRGRAMPPADRCVRAVPPSCRWRSDLGDPSHDGLDREHGAVIDDHRCRQPGDAGRRRHD